MTQLEACDLPWLWVSLPRATFSFFIDADKRIAGGSPYGMAIARRVGLKTAREAWQHFSRTVGVRFAWLVPGAEPREIRRAS